MFLCPARLATEKQSPACLPTHSFAGVYGGDMATKMTYREQLLHPNWQKKRLEILDRDEFTCQLCYDKESTLHVHHKHYVSGRLAWEYPDDELVTVCATCHVSVEESRQKVSTLIAQLPLDGPHSLNEVFMVLSGWLRINPEESRYSPYAIGEIADRLDWIDYGNFPLQLRDEMRRVGHQNYLPVLRDLLAHLRTLPAAAPAFE